MIKLVILDVDGVMTDGKKYYDRDGNVVMKNFCDKDWTAVKRFRAIGIPVVFLTGDPFNAKILSNRNLLAFWKPKRKKEWKPNLKTKIDPMK